MEKVELPNIINSLENYLKTTNNFDANKVGNELLGDLKNLNKFSDMFVLIALDEKNEILGISNGNFNDKYGLACHTIAFKENTGVGFNLFKTKIKYMLKTKKLVVAKAESEAGLKMILKMGFTEDPKLSSLLYFEGTTYVLNRK